jgi:hypothetical protein
VRALIVSIVVAGLATTTADATLLALWDAAFPGASPTTQWDDLSGNGNHLTNMGSTHDSVAQAFEFGGPDPGRAVNAGPVDGPFDAYFERTDPGASPFDFETDKAGGGLGTPFTVGFWYDLGVDSGLDDFVPVLMAKGVDRDTEWKIRPRGDGSNTDAIFNETGGGGPERLYWRQTGTPAGPIFLMVTHDGSGTAAGSKMYFNGVDQDPLDIVNDTLLTSIMGDAPLRVVLMI